MVHRRDFEESPVNILYIGSDSELSGQIDKAFSRETFNLFTAHSVDEARALVHNEKIDFAVVDQDVLGDQLFEHLAMLIEHSLTRVEFIIVSADPSLDVTLRAVAESQVAAYETKPVDTRQMTQLVQQLAEQNEVPRYPELDEAVCRNIVKSLRKGVWIYDADGRIRFANRRMAEMLRCERSGLSGGRCARFVVGETTGKAHAGGIDSSAKSNGHMYSHLRRSDGSSLWASVRKDRFDSPGGDLNVDIFVDISSQIYAEHMIIKQREILELQTEELGRFAANLRLTSDTLSNKLRAPLWRISGICQYLLNNFNGDLDPELTYCLRSLMKHSKDTTTILEKLINENQREKKSHLFALIGDIAENSQWKR